MEKETYYNVYRIYKGIKELIGTYRDPFDATEAGKKYNMPSIIIQIEKSSKPFS